MDGTDQVGVLVTPGVPPDGRGGPHAFVDDLERPVLHADDAHHLGRALRLRHGDPLTISDGRGGWRSCRLADPLELVGDIRYLLCPTPTVGVGFALIKGGRPELVVQKLTELGVDAIQPLVAERSVVRWDADKRAAQLERWRRIAREAAMQSRQVWLPEVAPVTDLTEVMTRHRCVLADRQGPPVDRADRMVLVGPEGGWTDRERSMAPLVGLGPSTVRAETACIAAATLVTALRAGIVDPARRDGRA